MPPIKLGPSKCLSWFVIGSPGASAVLTTILGVTTCVVVVVVVELEFDEGGGDTVVELEFEDGGDTAVELEFDEDGGDTVVELELVGGMGVVDVDTLVETIVELFEIGGCIVVAFLVAGDTVVLVVAAAAGVVVINSLPTLGSFCTDLKSKCK